MSAGFLHHLQHALGALTTGKGSACAAHMDESTTISTMTEADESAFEATARSIVVDFNGRVTSVGRYWKKHIPALREGTPLLDLVHIADRIAWMTALAEFKQAGEAAEVCLRLNKSDAQSPQCFIPIFFAFESACASRIRVDLWQAHIPALPATDDKAMSESDFWAMMSHEFRTPLNAILGFAGLLSHSVSEGLSASQKAEYIDLIRAAADHMLAMVNGILDVSKIGAGKYEIHPEPFDFKFTVDEAVSMLATQARDRQIKINVRPHLKDFGQVQADRRATKQILINLLSNAVKFTPDQGCVTIEAWFEQDTLAFAVSDTGIGMSEAEQKHIFSPFSQVDNGTTRQVEGTGLGLCLVKGLAGLHGGSVEVSSSKNVGTKMVVRIPNAAMDEPAAPCFDTTAVSRGGTDDALRQSA